MTEPLLSIKDLSVTFRTRSYAVRAVDQVSFDVYPGETLGVVGESGSGKSVTMLSVLRLLPHTARVVTSGQALFQGKDMLRASNRELRRIRGRHVALIPQDPMTSLDPVLRVGGQLREAIRAHESIPRAQQRSKAIGLLGTVGLPQPERQYGQFPHEYSGGMRQRAMIAMGMANGPSLLIADEPTTALDVTIQAQIMDVLRTAQRETQAGLVLITHDLGVIAEMADRVIVMYAGHSSRPAMSARCSRNRGTRTPSVCSAACRRPPETRSGSGRSRARRRTSRTYRRLPVPPALPALARSRDLPDRACRDSIALSGRPPLRLSLQRRVAGERPR